jgi:phosphoglycolate phosphatase-like HAD superfamily hydrolase
VLFDFDGTIADSLPTSFETFNRVAVRYGIEPMTHDQAVALRKLDSRAIMKRLGGLIRSSRIMRAAKADFARHIHLVPPFPGITDSILHLRRIGCTLGILSSNEHDTILAFLRQHRLTEHFRVIETGSPLFGKAPRLRRIRRRLQAPHSTVLYVGDETRDVQAATKARIHAAAVLWGANTREALAPFAPEHFLSHPDQLIPLVESGQAP